VDYRRIAYELGAQTAVAQLQKRASAAGHVVGELAGKALTMRGVPGPTTMRLLKLLGSKGGSGFASTAPFLAPLGGIAGGITGAATAEEGKRGKGALLGALLGTGIGGLAAGSHGALRSHLSKNPSKLLDRGGTIANPAAEEEFKRIFREAAGVAGAGGIASGAGAGLLGRKKD